MFRQLSDLTVLDGAFGTMLQAAGMRPGELPELINLTRGSIVRDIHRQYIEAGSRVVYANTFGANGRKLRGTGHTVAEVVWAAIRLAREAAEGYDVQVALDVGPLGELLEPMGTLSFENAYRAFAEIMTAGEKAGADLIVIETMTDLQECRAALLAAKENTSLPVWVTMSFDETGRTFTGCLASSMAATLTGLGASAIGVNCSLGPDKLAPVIKEIRRHTQLPIIAKPNAGLPDPEDGHYDMDPTAFAEAMRACVAAGAVYVGGCCGTNPAYIRALCAAMQEPVDAVAVPESLGGFVCSASKAVPLDRIRLIGERINPTGKKRFQQALTGNDLDYIVDVGFRQMDAGADILDVNVGMPGIEEETVLPNAVKLLQAVIPLPLQMDSTNVAALEQALRVYNGKAIVNSVNGKQEIMDAVFPIVKKYGAAVIGLTIDETGLPHTAQERVRIAERIVREGARYGIPENDILIDCLTLTVSAQQEQAEETLQALRILHGEKGFNTVLGVSNVSFGLPARPLITQTFLIRALDAGLTMPIINPNQKEIMDAIVAYRVLNGEDRQCSSYVARFADAQSSTPAAVERMSLDEAIVHGFGGEAARLAKEALKTENELTLVEAHLIPALDRVGCAYETGAAFLPQLLSAAQAAQSVFEVIKGSLAEKGGESIRKGRILMATVEGDIHDIGKNIVKTVLMNYGYEVIDLGKDVPPQSIVEMTEREHIGLVGLSALMTTTLPAMEKTVRMLSAMAQPPRIFVGGAVVTPEYAERIGADYYARDARASVEIARKVLGE